MEQETTNQALDKQQLMAQLNQQYQTLAQQVHVSANQYANGYINVANQVAQNLFSEGVQAEEAVKKGFEFAKVFEAAQSENVEYFREKAPIDSNLTKNIEQLVAAMTDLRDELASDTPIDPKKPHLAEVVNILPIPDEEIQ